MSKPIPATCNEGCQKNFLVRKFRTVKVKGGIEKNYFRCTHCKHEYVTYYANANTLKLQKDMRRLHVSMRGADATTYNKLVKQESELKAEIKKSMDDARVTAEGQRI